MVKQIDADRLVFVDEMESSISLSPIYAYSPKGQRAYGSVPRNRGPNKTLLSSMSTEGNVTVKKPRPKIGALVRFAIYLQIMIFY